MTTISSAYSPYATSQSNALAALSSNSSQCSEMPPPPPCGGECGGPSESERAEMRAFHESILAALESGEFDAETLAEQAPESINAFAEA